MAIARPGECRFSINEDERRSEADRIAAALVIVDKIIDNALREDPPWGDPYFRMAVCRRLREIGPLREAERKLAVVKEVFGGK